MASGLVLFTYITAHLVNHALGLISINAAEEGLGYAEEVWDSLPGTVLLYGAAGVHFLLALWAIYERRTFRLPPAELLRIAMGFTLPLILINHFANTRLAYEVFGVPVDYTRVISKLWAADSQGMQLGLLAPGWIHGCLGLHFAFSRRPLYRRLRFALFAVALLLPAFSAFGFIAMSRELRTNAEATAEAQDYLGPAHAAERAGIAHWHNGLLIGYFSLIGAAFAARAVRNGLEHGQKRLISISYPGRNVRIPRGWSVLEASRSFHLPHASMCGGRARCSTCRVQITTGAEHCPPAAGDEQATLERIGAAPDVRLACQLRPSGNISVVPLVQTAAPVYRPPARERATERDLVLMYCDFLNRRQLANQELPQDLLYLLTLYGEAISEAVRTAGGTLATVGLDGIGALFGLDHQPARAARLALQAAAAMERAISELDNRLGREGNRTLQVAVSIHAGRAVVGEIGSHDAPVMMAVGEAVDVANELRKELGKAAAAHGRRFAISEPVTTAAGVDPAVGDQVTLRAHGSGAPIVASLSTSAPPLPQSRSRLAERGEALQRLWKG
ncbi:MAG TPA: 2Fe-2S iron-sulfur cluster-binding protein [Xanthobacteraceae bacterium]